MTRGHTTRVIFTVKICILERSNEKSHFSKTEIYFHKKNCTTIIRRYWATKYESRSLSYWHPLIVRLLENTNTLRRLILCDDFLQYLLSEAMLSTQLNDAHFIVLASFVSREEMTVDKQLSEAETSSSACGWYKARLLSKDKRNSNLFFLAVDSRHFVGAWAKSNEINQAKKQACGAVVALALS